MLAPMGHGSGAAAAWPHGRAVIRPRSFPPPPGRPWPTLRCECCLAPLGPRRAPGDVDVCCLRTAEGPGSESARCSCSISAFLSSNAWSCHGSSFPVRSFDSSNPMRHRRSVWLLRKCRFSSSRSGLARSSMMSTLIRALPAPRPGPVPRFPPAPRPLLDPRRACKP